MILDKARHCAVPALLGALIFAAGCAPAQPATGPKDSHALTVIASISTLASLVEAVGGDRVLVYSLVPVGASPETYEPSPQDMVKLSAAQVLFLNGAGLEIWLAKILKGAAGEHVTRVELSAGLPVAGRTPDGLGGNPHLWMDPVYAQAYVRKINAALTAADPKGAPYYARNARAEMARLRHLDAWVRKKISTIPPQKRSMITFHDAWLYFDRRYGLRDVGVIELLPRQEPSASYLAKLIATAKENHVNAVFAEPQFSPKLANELATSAGIRTVTDLYDDTLGTTPELSSYDGMLRYDVAQIVKALST